MIVSSLDNESNVNVTLNAKFLKSIFEVTGHVLFMIQKVSHRFYHLGIALCSRYFYLSHLFSLFFLIKCCRTYCFVITHD